MRLTSIKLVGFKSFVDAVNVPFAGNMTAIVGPNGCGKSNIIDAVRWVMGESSAKTLRGESMTDVIFNGSTGRSPVGQASIELVFDNSDGTMGGAYAQYAEISVKRQVTRDSQSNYFFNGQKCRRRDISDLFLGTGLGPRSYAIIGQGMISRLVEARPEELRSTLEEAAGISKYKERRRETENRLRRTQENLERLDDIREELDKQLERLKRQADAARRYQTLKDDEYRLKGELALLRGRALRSQQEGQERQVRELETQVEREILGQRQCESQLEESRLAHDEIAAELEAHQARFYETGAAIARIEQSIEHARSRDQQLAQDIDDARRELTELEQLGAHDDERRAALDERLESIAPELEEAQETLEMLQESLDAADEEATAAQQEWERFNESDRDVAHGAERAQDDVRRLENAIAELDAQIHKRRQQREEVPDVDALRDERSELREQLTALDLDQEALESQRDDLQQQREQAQAGLDDAAAQRDAQRTQLSRLQGELASVEALLDAALADDDAALDAHLAQHGMQQAPRLAERLEVAEPWETAVAWVLAPWLKARVVDASAMAALLGTAPPAELALLDGDAGAPRAGTLGAQVEGAGALQSWLDTVQCADDEASAWALRDELAPGESVIAPSGLWLGAGWVRRRGEEASSDGVLVQRRRRETLQADIAALEASLETLEERLQTSREAVERSAGELESLRLRERELGQRRQQVASREAGLASRLEQLDARARELDDEIAQLTERHAERRLELEETRERWQAAMHDVDANSQTRESLEKKRREAREKAQSLRQQVAPARERQQQLAMERQRLETERAGLEQQTARSHDQRARLAEKLAMLEEQRATLREPEEETRERLDELLDRRGREEATLNAARDRAHQLAETLRDTEAKRQQHERNLDGLRGRLEEARMQVQALKLKADAEDAQLEELGHDVAGLQEGLDPNATESAWQTRLDEIAEKVRRLGAINLAAIEEYDQQAERRDYLEAQHAELSEAIETLEKAIRRIDQETRTRFKQTFDQVNEGFGELFPKVFGGGAAWLTLTGEDLLETGVAIMARPPGKKNTTIHLLSGGEKALTALSLVFAIFQLNPAPFCMLDEVDAPLDDANVGRYAKLVKEMSESVQFIYITHNKIAMEAAERLMGVTMQEPGVSRLVSVGIDEAAALADA
ncbi:chromosome segregation protein SMC [Chromohalobacter salexigens]|uniref:chromosome segregation protein SMC n=1 Tax=Chromohalobacter israelensis TaxID=141390 RepID=UPI0032E88A82